MPLHCKDSLLRESHVLDYMLCCDIDLYVLAVYAVFESAIYVYVTRKWVPTERCYILDCSIQVRLGFR